MNLVREEKAAFEMSASSLGLWCCFSHLYAHPRWELGPLWAGSGGGVVCPGVKRGVVILC